MRHLDNDHIAQGKTKMILKSSQPLTSGDRRGALHLGTSRADIASTIHCRAPFTGIADVLYVLEVDHNHGDVVGAVIEGQP